MSRIARIPRSLGLALASLAVACLAWRDMLRDLGSRHGGDWGYFEHMWEAARVQGYALWDPFHCGGVSLWLNPQSQTLHPLFALAYPFGSLLALKLFLLAHTALGFAGVYRLARVRGDLPVAAFTAALVWSSSGFFAFHGASGHSTFTAFHLAPWALLAWRRAEADTRGAVAVAAVFTLALLAGGTYPVPFLALLLAVDALPRMLRRDSRQGVVRAAAIALPLTMTLAAVRVVPIVVALRRAPRVMRERQAVSLRQLLDALTAGRHPYDVPGSLYAWDEYCAYIGWGALALAALGCAMSLRRRRFAGPMAALLFALLFLGDAAPWLPWPWIHRLPIFASLRVPSRFGVLLTLHLALLGAIALDRLARALREHPARHLVWVIPALIAADLTRVNGRIANDWDLILPSPPRAERFHLVTDDHYLQRMAALPARNVGTTRCYEPIRSAEPENLWIGDVPQVRVGEGVVRAAGRGVDRAWATVDLPCAGRVVFNQVFDPDWITDAGPIIDDAGRLAVELPAGSHTVRVRYAPRSLWPSFALSTLGVAASMALLRRRRGVLASPPVA